MHGRAAILGADFSLPGKHDARRLVRREKEQVLKASFEKIGPCLAREQKIQVAAVRMAPAIRVVRQRDNLFSVRQACIRAKHGRPGQAQHGVGGCDMIAGAQDFRNAQFQVRHVDIRAPPVGEEFATPILRVVQRAVFGQRTLVSQGRGCRVSVLQRLAPGRAGRAVADREVLAREGQAIELAQEKMRCQCAGAFWKIRSENEISEFEVRAAEFREAGIDALRTARIGRVG